MLTCSVVELLFAGLYDRCAIYLPGFMGSRQAGKASCIIAETCKRGYAPILNSRVKNGKARRCAYSRACRRSDQMLC